jgi:hypothetical protein
MGVFHVGGDSGSSKVAVAERTGQSHNEFTAKITVSTQSVPVGDRCRTTEEIVKREALTFWNVDTTVSMLVSWGDYRP